ncbi:MAG: tRNA pseudouridine(55) synthase TruB [Wolinella sp.]
MEQIKEAMKENAIFVGKKPIFMSSNRYLQHLKHRFGVKKAGYSGTLDPFATGVLIVAFGGYTRLFEHIIQEPKIYRATLWLGLLSDSLDIERVLSVQILAPFKEGKIAQVMEALEGEIEYTPPKYCAKKIGGKRAYELAREGRAVELERSKMSVSSLKMLNYSHPFVHFEAKVSKGAYVRSLGAMIARELGCEGALSSLTRVSEGGLVFEDYKPLDPLALIPYPRLFLPYLKEHMAQGRKLGVSCLGNLDEGRYIVEFEETFSIIEVKAGRVTYLLNRMEKC